MNKSLSITALATTFAILLGASQAYAANSTWVGNSSTDWVTGANWGGTAPVTGNALIFGAAGTQGASLTNTLTTSAFNVAGITFNVGASAYTMSGNTFNLTAGITNNSTVLQTFNNTGGLFSTVSATYATGTGGISLSGLTFTNGAVTTTVTGAGGLSIAALTLNNGARVTQTFNGAGNVTIGTIAGGTGGNNVLAYAGTGTLTVNGVSSINSVNTQDLVSSGTFLLASGGNIGQGISSSGTGTFTENSGGVLSGGGPVTQGSSTTMTLAGANTYTGATVVNSGTLSLTGSLGGATAITVNGGAFNQSGTATISGGGAIAVAGGTFNEGGGAVISAGSTITTTGGTTTLSGANTYTGATSVNGGTLTLDFSQAATPTTATNIIKSTDTVNLGGGTLAIKGNTSGTNTQTFATTALTTLTASKVVLTSNGATLNTAFGGITRNAQSSMDVALPALGTTSNTTSSALGGILVDTNKVAFATANGGTTWLTESGTTLGALGSYSSTYTTATNNVDVTNGDAPAAFTVNTLRFNAATDALTLTGTNILNTGGLLVTPGTAASISGAGTLTSGTTGTNGELVIHNYGTLNIGSVLANNGAKAVNLTLTGGSGITTLSAANTFSGQTSTNTGTLNLSNALALQNSTLQYNPGTTLVFDSSVTGNVFTLGGLNTNNNIALVNNATTPAPINLTVGGNNGTTSIGGVLSGAGSLTKTGSGTLNLNAGNTFTGGTAINGGTLFISSTGGLSSSVAVGTGAFLSVARPASESGTLGATSIISGAGGLVQNINNPNQAFTLDRPNTYTGPTQGGIRGGFIAGVASTYDGSGNQLTGAFGVNSQLQFTNGQAILALNGYANQVGSLSSTAGNGYIVLGGLSAGRPASVLTTGGDNLTANYQGTIADTSNQNSAFGTAGTMGGSIVKIGTGDQTLSGPNLYAGSTTIKGGILTVTTLANGGVATTASAASSASTTLSVASTAGLVVGQSLEVTGLPANATQPTITAIGTNSVTLSAAQTIANGTPLYFGNGNGLGISTNAASNLVLDGGTLQYLGTAVGTTDRLFQIGLSTDAGAATGTIDSSGVSSANTLSFTNAGAVTYGKANQADNLTLTGTNTGANSLAPLIADNGTAAVSVTKTGLGTWSLTGANTYSGGTTVNAGILTSAVTGGFGTGNVTVNPTGVLGTSADAATLNTTGSIASTALVTVNSSSATAIGTVNFNDSTPTIGGLSGTGKVVLKNATGTALTVGSTNNLSSTFNGVISEGTAGMGSLVKAGTGTFNLAGINTYSGATTVSGGTLIVSGSTASGSAVAINSGGTLGGASAANEGTLNGTVTVASGSPGGAINLQDGTIGTLHVGGLTVNGGTLSFDIGAGSTGNLDSIASAGTLSIAGATTINLGYVSGTPSLTNGTYSLITYNNGGSALGSTALGYLTLNTSALSGASAQTFTLVDNAGNLELKVATSTTPTSYTLTTSAGSTLLHAGASTTLTTQLTNTGTGTAASIDYSGVGASASGVGSLSGGTPLSGNLANGNSSVSNTSQTLSTTAGTSGTATISSTGSLTNHTIGGTPSGTPTGTSVTVYSGKMVWSGASDNTWATNSNWNDSLNSAVHAAPGLDAGFGGLDTATFGSQAATTASVGLNGVAPNLNSITFSSPNTAYTLAQNVNGGTGTSSLTVSGTTPSINVTNPTSSATAGTQTISAPLILGATTSLNVAANQTLNISGQVSSSGTYGLSNSGPGTTMLSNASGNAYTGPTTVTGGTVSISNTSGSATSTGAVTVGTGSANSGVLAGNGAIANSAGVTIKGGGSLTSGSSSQVSGTTLLTKGGMTLASTPVTIGSSVGTANLTFDLAANNTDPAGTGINGGAASGPNNFSNPNNNTTYLSLTGSSTINFAGPTSISLVDLTNTTGSNGSLSLRLSSPYLLIHAGADADYLNLVIATGTGVNTTYSLSQTGSSGYVVGVFTGGGTFNSANINNAGYVTPIAIGQYGANGAPLTGAAGGAYAAPALYLNAGNLEVVPEPGTWALMIGGLALLVIIQRRKLRH